MSVYQHMKVGLTSGYYYNNFFSGTTIASIAGALGGVGPLEAANCQGLELLRELQLLLLYTLIDYIGCQHVVLKFHQHI